MCNEISQRTSWKLYREWMLGQRMPIMLDDRQPTLIRLFDWRGFLTVPT